MKTWRTERKCTNPQANQGVSKQGKYLCMSSVPISVIRNASAVIEGPGNESALNVIQTLPKTICCTASFFVTSGSLWITCSVFLHQMSALFHIAPFICTCLSAIPCHLATKCDHNNLTYYNNKFPPPPSAPIRKRLLTGLEWKWRFILTSSYQSGPSETF